MLRSPERENKPWEQRGFLRMDWASLGSAGHRLPAGHEGQPGQAGRVTTQELKDMMLVRES